MRGWVRERYGDLLRQRRQRAPAGRGSRSSWSTRTGSRRRPRRARRRSLPADEVGLNPKYTFEQFVICDGNRFAHAAALAVAEMPGQAYNPLFLHGPPGSARPTCCTRSATTSHALRRRAGRPLRNGRGVHQRVRRRDPRRARPASKSRFRGADVLLLDDIQFLADKSRPRKSSSTRSTRSTKAAGQLVLTSDRAPADHRRPRSAAPRALRLRPRRRPRASRAGSAHGDPPQARPARRARHVSDETLLEIAANANRERSRTRGRADPRGRLRVSTRRATHRRARPPGPRRLHPDLQCAACLARDDPRRRGRRASASPATPCLHKIAAPRSPSPARSPCTSRAS